jgi:hypothetical protein
MSMMSIYNVRGQIILVLLFHMCLKMDFLFEARTGRFDASNADVDRRGVGVVNIEAGLGGE